MKYLLMSVLLLGIGIGLLASAMTLYPYSQPEIYAEYVLDTDNQIIRSVYFYTVNFPPVYLGEIGAIFTVVGLVGILFGTKKPGVVARATL